MAVLFKGVMPSCCGCCVECLGGGSDAYYCNRAKRQISEVVPPYDKRMEWCPILEEVNLDSKIRAIIKTGDSIIGYKDITVREVLRLTDKPKEKQEA